jgi:GNAT superfamily N-acetyltransferase
MSVIAGNKADRVSPTVRRGRPDDAVACHDVLWESITDFAARLGTPLEGTAEDWWRTGETVHRYLAEHAAEWWLAEEPDSGELVGYARSIERGGLFELTEFFVRPSRQSKGVGRALIERAFPAERGDVRSIIATGDVRAIARYYSAGTVARFSIFTLEGAPAGVEPRGGLIPRRLDTDADRADQARIERAVLGYGRDDAELDWLLSNREGYLYQRGDESVGFAFVGKDGSGPIAALDPADLPDILLQVEGRARAIDVERLDLEIPSLNDVAIRHLLGRGFRLNPWVNYLMSDRPFGQFDRFVCFSPPIFL